jgi:hypothetical protein
VTNARLTQGAVEVLRSGHASVHQSQVTVEVLHSGTPPVALAQVAAEVLCSSLTTTPANVNLTQFAVEVLLQGQPSPIALNQLAVEVLRRGQPAVSFSQFAVEVLYGNGSGGGSGGGPVIAEPYLWIIT